MSDVSHSPFAKTVTSFRRAVVGLVAGLMVGTAVAQVTVSENFKGTSASGWVFGGSATSTDPYLTAGVVPGDTAGNGWLRMTENLNNQSTFALWDNAIFSVNAQIQIELEYAFYNGSGADGLTFFLVDGSINASTFQPGAFGGSLGYAQKDAGAAPPSGVAGMDGGYLGFGLDNFGNYSNPTEGRIGGPGSRPNSVAVRGPESSNFAYIGGATLDAYGQMDFPSSTTRPDQSGADFRSFRMTLDANNQLTVEMKFGASSSYVTVFTSDLSIYDRPETFKIGFTAATGGSTEIHEIRNVAVTMTPWQPSAFEWDNGANTTTWGATPGAANNNWYHAESGSNNETPTANADILFGNKPSVDQTVTLDSANRKVNSITFDSGVNYTVNGTGSLIMGDTGVVGLPSINVNDYNGEQGQHHLNLPISVAETLTVNNYSFSTLCLNGAITTNGNDIKVNGWGATNFNADINGSGNLIKNGAGIVTINSDNSNGATPWTGNVTINEGMVVVTKNGALGTTGGTTTVNSGGVLAFRAATGNVGYTTAESVSIAGRGVSRGGEGDTGAVYNDGGNNSFSGNITMTADAAVGSRDGVLTLSGAIGQSGGTRSLTKLGDGVVSLTGTNTYRGNTVIEDGVLRVTDTSLTGGYDTTDTGSNYGAVILSGGVLELATATNFTRNLGTGEEQIAWAGDGGFSASGGNRTINLSGDARLTWASTGGFVGNGYALMLSSAYSDGNTTFDNNISLNGAQREVRVANGSAAVDATLSGNLRGGSGNSDGSGGLIKTGAGTLALTGSNDYNGATEIRGGALRGNLSADSNLVLNGGVMEIAGDYTAALGTGAGQVRWEGDGGFAALGSNRTVNLGGANAGVTWGSTTHFVGANSKLILGSTSANRTVTLTNAINLNGGDRTVLVQNGSATTDAVLSGILSNGSLTVVGAGRLDSTGINTLGASDNATLTVKGAEFRLLGTGTATTLDNIVVREGGTFTLDNSSTSNNDRILNTATVTLNGGTFAFRGRGNNVDSSESVGALTLSGGANTIQVVRTQSDASGQLTFSSLAARTNGATVDFTTEAGTIGSSGDNPRALITGLTATNGMVGGWATVGNNWATYNAATGIAAQTTYETSATATDWATTENISIAANATNAANRTVNSFRLDGASAARTLDLDNDGTSRTFTVTTGGIMSLGNATNIIKADNAGSSLRSSGTNELFVNTYDANNTLQINAQIANATGNTNALVKTGDGTLVLGGTMANTYTGTTYVNAGTLALNKTAGVNAIAGNIVVGDGRGTDILRLDADEQIANTSNLKLVGSAYGTGETVLQFNGGSSAGISETLGTLTIEGTAVIDFAGGNVCDANFLFLDDLLMASPDSMLYIRNWVDFTDFLLVKNTANLSAVFSQIKFEGYGDTAYWESYDSTYSRITPVPEPSTYGALFMVAALGAFGFKRWRQSRRRTA